MFPLRTSSLRPLQKESPEAFPKRLKKTSETRRGAIAARITRAQVNIGRIDLSTPREVRWWSRQCAAWCDLIEARVRHLRDDVVGGLSADVDDAHNGQPSQ